MHLDKLLPQRWDIFCTVIDNYGDIGVCWRLARQLADEYGVKPRLWVDDLQSFAHIQPEIDSQAEFQSCCGVEIAHWCQAWRDIEPANVVIEAFACHLPVAYEQAMRRVRPVWINLEYLSAEDWVEGCHQLPSPQQGLQKYFFFPGFTSRTGGVLGESAMRHARENWGRKERDAWLAQYAVLVPKAWVISLFAYENAAITGLLHRWAIQDQPIHVLLPEGRLLPQVSKALGKSLSAGQTIQQGSLTLTCLSMLPQAEYDHLLWSCDLNFVRGEDSFVRAQWAALPMVWHIYPQDEDAHWVKLQAFLELYAQGLDAQDFVALQAFWRAWNRGERADVAWPSLFDALPNLLQHARLWRNRLTANGDLASNLVKFVWGKVE